MTTSPVQYIRPRNWHRFQGYLKRGPTWIKNFVGLLDKPEYRELTPNCRAVLHGLWLLTARTGRPLPYNTRDIGAQLAIDSRATGVALKQLLSLGFIELVPETVARSATGLDENCRIEKESEKESEGSPPIAPPQSGPNSRGSPGQGFVVVEDTDRQDIPSPGPPKASRKPARGPTALPADWQPTEKDLAWARNQGFTDDQVTAVTANFLRYWHLPDGNGRLRRKRDWSRTWKNSPVWNNPPSATGPNAAVHRRTLSERVDDLATELEGGPPATEERPQADIDLVEGWAYRRTDGDLRD